MKNSREPRSPSVRVVALGGEPDFPPCCTGSRSTSPSPGRRRHRAAHCRSDSRGYGDGRRRKLRAVAPRIPDSPSRRHSQLHGGALERRASPQQTFSIPISRGTRTCGHSFGNLFLTALTNSTGDFPKAVQLSAQVLAIRGRIFPSTAQNVTLKAELEDGKAVAGETKISRSRKPIRRV